MTRLAKLLCVVGARPNFMKVAPVLSALGPHAAAIRPVLVHTGQHYDPAMSDVFFADLGLPAPDRALLVGSGSHAEQTGRTMVEFERCLDDERPDAVLVVGDVNSTLACALVAAKARVPLFHVEAGLRSRDPSMPEEVNRRVADLLSDLLFTHCREADDNLRAEGVPDEKVLFVGNVMVDTLLRARRHAAPPAGWAGIGLQPSGYGLVTLHRPALVDDPRRLGPWVRALAEASADLPLAYPVHPRTRARLVDAGLVPRDASPDWSPVAGTRLFLGPPLGYLEMVGAMAGARLAVTDSGGVQEETSVLGVPCLTARDNTERGVTVREGTASLLGTDPAALGPAVREVLGRPPPGPRVPERWDGRAGERIAAVLVAWARGERDLRGVVARAVEAAPVPPISP